MILYAHRNIALWQDSNHAQVLAQQNGVPKIALFVLNPAETKVVAVQRLMFDRASQSGSATPLDIGSN
jgi:hypothetical protein